MLGVNLAHPRRLLVGGLSAVLVIAGGATYLGAVDSADAATPPSGTIAASGKHAVSWTGGPFVAPNATGTGLDAPDCSAPESCDDFQLKVKTPGGYGKNHQLTVSVAWENTAADFDVYLLDKDGNSVATAATSADPELIITAPKAGTYTVRVVPFTPVGESYTATAKLTKTPANPDPGTATPPTFKNYKPGKDVSPDVNNAGEPSIGNNFKTGATLYQAYLSTFRFGVKNGKGVWKDVSANAQTGCPQGSTQSLDPILFTDHQTGRTFESQLTGQDSLTCYTDDDGASWLPSQGGGLNSGVDHQSIGGGPYADGGSSLPTTDYPNTVYYCSQDIAAAFCASSMDGGTTFGAGIPTYNLTQCGGLHGHVKVAPDGTAYLPNKSCGANAAVSVSRDNGQTWNVYGVPSSTPGDSDPSVGIGKKGRVFLGYVGADGKPGVATSTNHGENWKYGQKLGQDLGVKTAVFPTMVAGDDDRAALAYLGTTTGGDYQNADTFKGVWHLYVSTTYDGGRTWVTRDATPKDPVQRGSLCTGGTTCGNDRNLLDFIDVTTDKHGRVLVGYADGCIDACVNDPKKNNNDAYATIARQSGGRTLFAKYDRKHVSGHRNVKLTRLQVVKRNGDLVARITIKNTGSKPIRKVGARVKDNGHVEGQTHRFNLPVGASRTGTVRWHPGPAHRHLVSARADTANRIRETNERDNKRHVSVYLP
ncbi:pre-peptidase C-terminal domain-containing protein [Nocardioides sp. KIGAM211]|uniref:Pre-peptidase C-terminal domain-containing protein n=1 Tax=Nocardioides luti TaxID=2761101 RepID=A0A7X0VC88_9ACTN|nr:CARDB domain-containing protein [Nocardioides luti]MBB6627988.1 pre-peptidase C-terminal domain-containing protein [Nocardioides luti]